MLKRKVKTEPLKSGFDAFLFPSRLPIVVMRRLYNLPPQWKSKKKDEK